MFPISAHLNIESRRRLQHPQPLLAHRKAKMSYCINKNMFKVLPIILTLILITSGGIMLGTEQATSCVRTFISLLDCFLDIASYAHHRPCNMPSAK